MLSGQEEFDLVSGFIQITTTSNLKADGIIDFSKQSILGCLSRVLLLNRGIT